MPYSCALAVCTTFCAHIAGALIPIFGPNFPSQCVPPEAPEHGRMIINASIVAQATAEAEAFRQQYTIFTPRSAPRDSYSPQYSVKNEHNNMGITPPTAGRHLRLKRPFGGDSPYGTSTDTDGETSSGDGYFCSPRTPGTPGTPDTPGTPGTPGSLSQQRVWGCSNMISHSANSSINMPSLKALEGPNRWLSAIPRSTGLADVYIADTWRGKRRADEADADDEYDGEDSPSVVDDKGSDRDVEDMSGGAAGVEKKAAWLLMKLSVKDGECGAEAAP
jgi:hypothetical protein